MTAQDVHCSSSGSLRIDPAVIALIPRLGALVVLAGALTFATEGFATVDNLLNVLRQASLLFLVASGLTLVIVGGGLDLSVAANLTLSACLAAGTIKATGSSVAGVAMAMACGLLIGACNALLVSVLRVPSFLATYGMLWVVQGVAYTYMGGQVIYGLPPALRILGTGFLLGVPIPIWLMAAIVLVAMLLMSYTAFGREIFLMGVNETAARLSGIPVDQRRFVLYTLSGLTAGLASVVYLGRVNAAEAGLGEPLLLPAVAAVLVGGTSLFGGRGSVFGTALGALILTVVVNGLNLLDVSAAWHPLITGLIVVLAVALDGLGERRQH